MKAEPHTMTLKTKQHSWLRGVQFFRKHIMWGMWTRAWLSLFCLCFFLSFFILRLSGLCTADEHSVSLPDLTYALTSYRVREHLAHVKMLVKSFLDLPPQSLLISYLFFFFFYQIWVWASLSGLDTVEIQHESQTNTKWSEQYQQDDWKQCMTAQGDNLEGCRFDWNSL